MFIFDQSHSQYTPPQICEVPVDPLQAWCNGDIEHGAVSVSSAPLVARPVFPKVNRHGIRVHFGGRSETRTADRARALYEELSALSPKTTFPRGRRLRPKDAGHHNPEAAP